MAFSFEGVKPTIVNPLEVEKKAPADGLEHALEKYPASQLMRALASLPSEEQAMFDRALNMAGESFHAFGSFEEYEEADAVAEVREAIEAFAHAASEEKAALAQRLVERVSA